MPSFNQVILIGNLTRDPELRYTPSGTALCEFGLAINERWKDKAGNTKEEVSFLDCIAWARTAEVICEYFKKGKSIMVVGSLRQDRWQDQASGQNRSKVKINVRQFQFVGGKEGSDAAGGPPVGSEEPPAAAPAPEAGAGIADEDVPF